MHTMVKLNKTSTKKSFSSNKLSHFISVITLLFLACIVIMLSALNSNKIMELAKGKSNTPTIIYTEQTQEQPKPLIINF